MILYFENKRKKENMRSESERKCAVVEWAGELWKEGEKEGDETNGSIYVYIYIYMYVCTYDMYVCMYVCMYIYNAPIRHIQ